MLPAGHLAVFRGNNSAAKWFAEAMSNRAETREVRTIPPISHDSIYLGVIEVAAPHTAEDPHTHP